MIYLLTKQPAFENGFVRVEYAAWPDLKTRNEMLRRGYCPAPGDIIIADENGRDICCPLVNNHKVQLTSGCDITARVLDVIEGFLSRETARLSNGWRDQQTGRFAWRRDARGTTLNLQVGATGDDVRIAGPATFSSGDTQRFAGMGSGGSAYSISDRWTGLPGTAITINSATVQYYHLTSSAGAGNLELWFRFELAASPTAPTSYSDFTGRTRTTAKTTVTTLSSGTWNFYDVTSSLAEVCEAYNPATAQLFVDGQNAGTNRYNQYYGYGLSAANAAKLDVDYTAGASPGGSTPARSSVRAGVAIGL